MSMESEDVREHEIDYLDECRVLFKVLGAFIAGNKTENKSIRKDLNVLDEILKDFGTVAKKLENVADWARDVKTRKIREGKTWFGGKPDSTADKLAKECINELHEKRAHFKRLDEKIDTSDMKIIMGLTGRVFSLWSQEVTPEDKVVFLRSLQLRKDKQESLFGEGEGPYGKMPKEQWSDLKAEISRIVELAKEAKNEGEVGAADRQAMEVKNRIDLIRGELDNTEVEAELARINKEIVNARRRVEVYGAMPDQRVADYGEMPAISGRRRPGLTRGDTKYGEWPSPEEALPIPGKGGKEEQSAPPYGKIPSPEGLAKEFEEGGKNLDAVILAIQSAEDILALNAQKALAAEILQAMEQVIETAETQGADASLITSRRKELKERGILAGEIIEQQFEKIPKPESEYMPFEDFKKQEELEGTPVGGGLERPRYGKIPEDLGKGVEGQLDEREGYGELPSLEEGFQRQLDELLSPELGDVRERVKTKEVEASDEDKRELQGLVVRLKELQRNMAGKVDEDSSLTKQVQQELEDVKRALEAATLIERRPARRTITGEEDYGGLPSSSPVPPAVPAGPVLPSDDYGGLPTTYDQKDFLAAAEKMATAGELVNGFVKRGDTLSPAEKQIMDEANQKLGEAVAEYRMIRDAMGIVGRPEVEPVVEPVVESEVEPVVEPGITPASPRVSTPVVEGGRHFLSGDNPQTLRDEYHFEIIEGDARHPSKMKGKLEGMDIVVTKRDMVGPRDATKDTLRAMVRLAKTLLGEGAEVTLQGSAPQIATLKAACASEGLTFCEPEAGEALRRTPTGPLRSPD